MKFSLPQFLKKSVLWVSLISGLIGLWLWSATKDMLFWPTDTEVYYLEAAKNLPHLKYISQMHIGFDTEFFRFLHGKEFYILAASWVQQLLHDSTTLRPFLLICILSITLSGILIFLISRRIWGSLTAGVCYFLFVTCFWPYQQILYTGHLPQGLFLFLLAVWVLFAVRGRRSDAWLYLLCGVLLGLTFYSSPVAPLYFPYFLAAFIYALFVPHPPIPRTPDFRKSWCLVPWCSGALLSLGFLAIIILFNYPDVIGNLKKYFQFVEISSSRPHFFYNQPILIQWIAHPELPVRGGWLWVVKYFLLILPVVFPLFVAAGVYLISKIALPRRKGISRGLLLAMVILGWSSPLIAEARGVAQLGRSYFPSLVGMLVLIGFAVFLYQHEDHPRHRQRKPPKLIAMAVILAILHLGWNAAIFFSDIYPSRMGVTSLAKKIKAMGVSEIYTYVPHPHIHHVVDCFPTDLLRKTRIVSILSVMQPAQGVILIPPATGVSIYTPATSSYIDFDKDLVLNELFRKGNIADYAIASFPTLASSPIWSLEEEILAYKQLILNQGIYDPKRTMAWLLDAAKIRRDMDKNMPTADTISLRQQGVFNIGTVSPVNLFEGKYPNFPGAYTVPNLLLKVYKVGNPADSLVAYLYKVSPEEPLWIPVGKDFATQKVPASAIPSSPQGGLVPFSFSQPLNLPAGRYRIVAYRTGKPDDRNYYRIYLYP